MKDYTGIRFGRLTVQRFVERRSNRYYWECLCDCGNTSVVESSHFSTTKSCGCLRSRSRKDLTGQQFGKLTAVRDVGKEKHGYRLWLCKCNCGNTKIVASGNLTSGHAKSCGCLGAPFKNLVGYRNSMLTVIEDAGPSTSGHGHLWRCRCDCGNVVIRSSSAIKKLKSCGCQLGQVHKQDITGRRYGKLIAVKDTGEHDRFGNSLWLCSCDCGGSVIANINTLNNRHIKSCGCLSVGRKPKRRLSNAA